jgi:hypothetical protein
MRPVCTLSRPAIAGYCIIVGGGMASKVGVVRRSLQHNHENIIFRRLAHKHAGESFRRLMMTFQADVLAEMRHKRLCMFVRLCATRASLRQMGCGSSLELLVECHFSCVRETHAGRDRDLEHAALRIPWWKRKRSSTRDVKAKNTKHLAHV